MLYLKGWTKPLLALVFLVTLIIPGFTVISTTAYGHAIPAKPAQPKPQDPSGYTLLKYNYYEFVPVQLYTGMNATFAVYSNTTVDVYFMTAAQFSGYQSGSTQSIYHSEGQRVSANIGPFTNGTYYLVIDDDVSQHNAYVYYSISTLPVNIYSFHSSLPAPVGIADYGVMNSSGLLYPYKILYEEAIGIAQIYSLKAYNSSPPTGISPYGASLQQNVVLQVNTTTGNYVYWLQNVPSFWTNNDTMYFVDNIWNNSALISYLTNQTITGKGNVGYSGNDTFYGYETSLQSYNLPLTLYLITNYTYSNNAVYVSFGYTFSQTSPITWYDNVTIHDSGVTSASLVVSGYNYAPNGGFYDSELVFGGEGGGEQTYFTQMNANLFMWYVLPNGSVILPPAIYGFGSDTAEAADDLSTTLVNGYPTVELGRGNFEPVGYSAQFSTFSAELTLFTSAVDSGMKVPVALNSVVKNGLGPYTYYFYIDGKAVYNFTTYNSQFSKTIYLPPLKSGTYRLQVAVFDSAGHNAYSSIYDITVNPDPVAVIYSNVTTTDVGLPLNISVFANKGTPPYNYSLYINGNLVAIGNNSYSKLLKSDIFVPNRAGTWSANVVLTDSAGYTVRYTLNIQVNPDPVLSLTYNRNVTDVGLPVSLNVETYAGTPQYTYSWYLNGQKVGSNTSIYYFNPESSGVYKVEAVVSDLSGYKATRSVIITVNNDPIILNLTPTLSSNNIFFTNNVAQLRVNIEGGTPTYNYSWYLNGKLLATTSSPVYSYSLSAGQNTVQAKITDSLGYGATSQPVTINTSYNYAIIGGLVAIIVIAVILVAVVLRRRH